MNVQVVNVNRWSLHILEKFIQHFGEDFRWSKPFARHGRWYGWSGELWVPEVDSRVMEAVVASASGVAREQRAMGHLREAAFCETAKHIIRAERVARYALTVEWKQFIRTGLVLKEAPLPGQARKFE